MNRYNSVTRRFWALGVIDVPLTQPSISIAANPGYDAYRSRMFQIDQNALNPNGVLVIRTAGLYSNFADGLVFHSPVGSPPPPPTPPNNIFAPQLAMQTLSFDAGSLLPGTSVTTVAGSDQITGVDGPFAGLAPGDYLRIQNFITRVLTVTSPDQIGVTTPPLFSEVIPTMASSLLRKLTLIGFDNVPYLPVWSLNDPQQVDEYVNPLKFGGVASAHTAIEGWVKNDVALKFDTISIDPLWIPVSSVQFSIAIDLEYTRR